VLLVKEIESDITINLPSFRKRFYVQGASSTADSEPIRAENGSLVHYSPLSHLWWHLEMFLPHF